MQTWYWLLSCSYIVKVSVKLVNYLCILYIKTVMAGFNAGLVVYAGSLFYMQCWRLLPTPAIADAWLG